MPNFHLLRWMSRSRRLGGVRSGALKRRLRVAISGALRACVALAAAWSITTEVTPVPPVRIAMFIGTSAANGRSSSCSNCWGERMAAEGMARGGR